MTREGRSAARRLRAPLAVVLGLLLLPALAAAAVSCRNTISPRGIIVHHSVVTQTSDGRPLDIGVLSDAHRKRGFGIFYWGRTYNIGYHYVIFPDGTVAPGRPERCRGAHAVGHNDDLGVCLVGDFSTTDNPRGERRPAHPTPEQMSALAELCRRLQSRYDIPARRVLMHYEVANHTECPGDRFPVQEFLRRLGGDPGTRQTRPPEIVPGGEERP